MAKDGGKMRQRSPSPAELRNMLGDNLRQLSQQAASISALCRELGINRTQYNRYLAGESFPRPDVLHARRQRLLQWHQQQGIKLS